MRDAQDERGGGVVASPGRVASSLAAPRISPLFSTRRAGAHDRGAPRLVFIAAGARAADARRVEGVEGVGEAFLAPVEDVVVREGAEVDARGEERVGRGDGVGAVVDALVRPRRAPRRQRGLQVDAQRAIVVAASEVGEEGAPRAPRVVIPTRGVARGGIAVRGSREPHVIERGAAARLVDLGRAPVRDVHRVHAAAEHDVAREGEAEERGRRHGARRLEEWRASRGERTTTTTVSAIPRIFWRFVASQK